jgi:hypothetical protein
LLLFAINQTLNTHCQASQPYQYTNADIYAIAHFISAPVSFNQCMVDLALIKQACNGPRSTKHENCLPFHCQLEETRAYCATNAQCKEAYKKSLTACLQVLLANHLVPAASISATPIALKPILIDFKKVQGENCIKVF